MSNRMTVAITALVTLAFASSLKAQDRPADSLLSVAAVQAAAEYVLEREGWDGEVAVHSRADAPDLKGKGLSDRLARFFSGGVSDAIECGAYKAHREPWLECIFERGNAILELHEFAAGDDRATVQLRLWRLFSAEIETNNRAIHYSHWELQLKRSGAEWAVVRVLGRSSVSY